MTAISLPPGITTRAVWVDCGCPRGGRNVNMHITESGIALLRWAVEQRKAPPDFPFETWWCRGCKRTVVITVRHLHAAAYANGQVKP